MITRIMHHFNKNIFWHLISLICRLTNLVDERNVVAKYLTVSQVITEDKLKKCVLVYHSPRNVWTPNLSGICNGVLCLLSCFDHFYVSDLYQVIKWHDGDTLLSKICNLVTDWGAPKIWTSGTTNKIPNLM